MYVKELMLNNSNVLDKSNKISMSDKISYGIGNFSVGIAIQVVGAFLMFYCTAILNIPGSLVGVVISIGIAWDAITDPLMGYISDNTKSKTFGRRHLYLIIGGIGIGICNLILWNIPGSFSAITKFTIIFIDIIAIKTFMTIYITPYTALGAELSNDYNERTSIQGIKTIFFLLGIFFVSVVILYAFFQPTVEFPIGQLNPKAYSNMGIFSSIIIVVFSLVCYFFTKKYIPILRLAQNPTEEKAGLHNLLASFKGIIGDAMFRSVALSYMFTNIASAMFSNIGLHVFTYTFILNNQQIALMVGTQFAVSILSQPAWTFISKKIDKKPSIKLGLALCIIASAYFFALVVFKNHILSNAYYFLPFAILAGFGTGGLFTLPLSMIADIIDLEELRTGKRSEGTYYGCLTLFYKFSQSITLLLVGFVLDIIKFNSSLPVQSESTVVTLGFILSITTSLSFVAAFLSIKKYSLDKSAVEDIQKQIAERMSKVVV
jgi:glycoside/pentoside/hexuronide:cation symporter, GPH family